MNSKLQGYQHTVLKIFLQVTDPLVTETGSKQEPLKAEKLQICLQPYAEFTQNKTKTENKRSMLSHTMRSFHKPTPAQDKACSLIQSKK